jgi:hypothetical protein
MSTFKPTWELKVADSEKPELIGQLIDIFEDFLDDKGITTDDIPNPEREEEDDCSTIIYGTDYDVLADKIASVLGFER